MRTCAAYDSTVQALGFDAIRVRYRKERRKLIQQIILNNKVGKSLNPFIQTETTKLIPQSDQAAFIEDIYEDLSLIDESYLAELGVDIKQLNHWLTNHLE